MKKVKYVGKIYNLFIVSIIATMLVSIIITVLSSITVSTEATSMLTSIKANNEENFYSTEMKDGAVGAPNYASVSNLNNQNASLVGANYVSSNMSSFSLADYIPLNTQIKNQGATSNCWTFASLSALQTGLALNDYLNDRPAYNYDFAERHLALSSVETSSNPSGYNRNITDGATYWMAMNYFSRAAGPVLENECQFSTDNTTVPNASNTYNLNKAATVTEMKLFPSPGSDGYNLSDQINNMKTHIRQKGALCATMYFPLSFPDTTYNTSTGASYVNSSSYDVNHMVSIIGWDDNYSKDNFNSSSKPSRNGAWLIRNSHGTHPYTDNGFLHISYEDALIYNSVFGIDYADLANNYTKTISYAEKGMNSTVLVNGSTYTLYNVFDRNKNNNINEMIESISMYLLDDSNISIAIAEGDLNTNRNLTFIPQTISDGTNVAPGFRTFRLSTPYKFNTTSSNSSNLRERITVKITVTSTASASSLSIPLEGAYSKSYATSEFYTKMRGMIGTTTTETGKCFVGVGTALVDLGNIHSTVSDTILDGDSTVQLNLVEGSRPLGTLGAKTPPTKTQYNPGENFDPTGLTMEYNAGNGSMLNINLADCTLKKDESMTDGQTYVEVYGYGKTADIPITVGTPVEMTPTLAIKTNPTKTNYKVGDNFDPTGLVLKYTHGYQSNPTVDEIQASAVTITDGTNLQAGKTYVTAKYNNLTVQIPITVTAQSNTPSYDDSNNLSNTVFKLNEVRFNSTNESGFDSLKVTVNNIVENDGGTYTYRYYISNGSSIEGSKKNTEGFNLSNGTVVLDFDASKVSSDFKLKTEDDNIFVTIVQENTITGGVKARTVQLLGDENTKYYLDGNLKTSGSANTNDPTTPGSSAGNTTNENALVTDPTTTSGGSQTTPKTTSGDTTIATKKIPQTGTAEEIFKIVIISITLVAGAFIVKTYAVNRKMSGK